MTIEIIPNVGGQPIRIEAAQFLVRDENGTPIAVGGEYGLQGAICIVHAGEASFNRTLRAFGYGEHEVICIPLELPKPAGTVLSARK